MTSSTRVGLNAFLSSPHLQWAAMDFVFAHWSNSLMYGGTAMTKSYMYPSNVVYLNTKETQQFT